MYDFIPQTACPRIGQESDIYDDDYDEYLMWHSKSSYIMVRVDMSGDNGVPLIPALEQRELLQMTSFVSPLCVSYTATPDFKFPAVPDRRSRTLSSFSADTDSSTTSTRVRRALTVFREGLQNTKRRFSNIF